MHLSENSTSTTNELPQPLAVLPESPSYLAHMAEPSHSRAHVDVGEICGNPAPAPVVATSDHHSLGERGESRLKNPLREICTVVVCEGENYGAMADLNAHEAENGG
jgi:hypothetical protein